jgi:ParB family transcriptional regulator, chromosome partitioning protein
MSKKRGLHENDFGVKAIYSPANMGEPTEIASMISLAEKTFGRVDVLVNNAGIQHVLPAGWKPTVDNYLGRVTKPRILQAVREAKGETSAQLIDHLKKADMAREAERLLDGAGWLPEPLRLTELTVSTPEQEADAGPLPEFLVDEEDKTDNEDEQPRSIAAE